MKDIKYMFLDETLHAYIDDAIYYLAEFVDGKWERSIPLPMISYNVRRDITEKEALEITNGIRVDSLFGEIEKEIIWLNREKTQEEIIMEFFKELVHCYKRDFFLLKQDRPDFIYSVKELDEYYGGDLFEKLNIYYNDYLKLKEQGLFNDLLITKLENDYIIEFYK